MAMACIVVFGTTYALILPAITMSNDTYCGKEEHVHTQEECYERVLVCGYDDTGTNGGAETQHQHSDSCYETRRVLVCGLEESAGHTHTEACYTKQLICGQEEREGHTHTESCYDEAGNLICGLEEDAGHIHNDSCYQDVLICGQEESAGHTHSDSCYQEERVLVCTESADTATATTAAHVHTDACYEERLVCTKEEHVHSSICYSNPNADVEDASVWENTIPKNLGVNWAENVVSVANSQLGYTESTKNYEVDEDGSLRGYTRYGAWYGTPYGDDWSAMFASFCLSYAGVPQTTVPYGFVSSYWMESVQNAGLYESASTCTPKAGYIVFFDTDSDGVVDHTGVVTEVTKVTEDGSSLSIKTIEGDVSGKVTACSYASGDGRITGYVVLPKNPNAPADEPETSAEENLAETSAAAEEADASVEETSEEESELVSEEEFSEDESEEEFSEEESEEESSEEESEEESSEEESEEESSEEESEEESSEEESEEESSEALEMITKIAEIYTDDSYTTLAEDDETVITLTGLMPENARVVAYPKELEIDNLVCAYDITILTEDDEKFEPDAENPISVCIQLPAADAGMLADLDEESEGQTDADAESDSQGEMTICYISDDGEIEQIPAESDEDGLHFEAEHFSVYAVMAAATTTGVSNASELSSAFNKAGSGDVIKLTGDITIYNWKNSWSPITISNKNLTLDLNGHHITISSSVNLFNVTGGSLTIKNSAGDANGSKSFTYQTMTSSVTNQAKGTTSESTQSYTVSTNGYIQGNASAIVNVTGGTFKMESGLLCDGTGRAIYQSGGTVNLAGGYINGFTKTGGVNDNNSFGGAVRITGGTLNLSGTVLSNNKALNGGAIYNNGGTINMTGGVISKNTSTRSSDTWSDHSEKSTYKCGGGGIYADNASKTNISGGYVSFNTTTDTKYFDGGGGILLSGDNTTLSFSGGYITGNSAAGGGGIRTSFGSSTIVNMTGGYLSGNTSTAAEGGGANFDRGCTATITAGYITNNSCTKGEHWGGGGLFCADGATLNLRSALITLNKGDGFGAGVGGCSTGKLYLYVNQGCAVYDNTATGKNYAEGGAKADGDSSKVAKYPKFLQNGYADFFCALNSSVMGTMLGNNAANWQGTADGKIVKLEKDQLASAKELMGLTAHPTDEAKAKAESLATLYITGNYAVTHGAGVMCNGNLVIGVPENIENPAYLTVVGTKSLLKGNNTQSLEGKTFTFQIKDASGNVVATGTNDSSGNITFSSPLEFKATGTYTYYISEVQPENSGTATITYDTRQYKLVVTVTRDSGTELYGETYVYNYLISKTTLQVSTDGGKSWSNVTASVTDNVLTLPATDGASFINREKDKIDIPVKKVWKDVEGDEDTNPSIESITVILYQDEQEYDRQVLNKDNDWSYTWKDLPIDNTYRVEEEYVSGYKVTYEYTDGGTWVITNQKSAEYALPSTGGSGTFIFTICGVFLIAVSVLLGYLKHRRLVR